METHRRVIIIGSGPAGLTAAIYTARADLKPLVIEGVQQGGQLTITSEVENFPGFPAGILGPQLMDLLREQAEKFGTEYITDEVSEVILTERPFRIRIGKKEFTSDSLIIATGATAKLFGLPGENEMMGHGLSACATCDGWFFRDKEIAVLGGGDSACEEGTYLTKFASKVTIIHRRAELRASKIMQHRATSNPKVEFLWNKVVLGYLGDPGEGLKGLNVRDTITGEESDFFTDGVFIAIGHKPNTELFAGQLNLNIVGYIETVPGSTRTNVPGVFACGDVQDSVYRQAITAAGTGCMAAIEVERYLTEAE